LNLIVLSYFTKKLLKMFEQLISIKAEIFLDCFAHHLANVDVYIAKLSSMGKQWFYLFFRKTKQKHFVSVRMKMK